MSSAVKHPSHYSEGRKYEPKDVIRDWQLGFNLGNAVKYIARAGRKDDIVQDLEKAKQYLEFEIEAIKAETENKTYENVTLQLEEITDMDLISVLDFLEYIYTRR
jgi:hypothetical protein